MLIIIITNISNSDSNIKNNNMLNIQVQETAACMATYVVCGIIVILIIIFHATMNNHVFQMYWQWTTDHMFVQKPEKW